MNCESCGMPLDETSMSKVDGRYCVYCQDQTTGDLKSEEDVREGSINAAVEFLGKTREEAEKMADETMPTLPRWQINENEIAATSDSETPEESAPTQEKTDIPADPLDQPNKENPPTSEV